MFGRRGRGWIGVDLGPRTLALAQAERAGPGVRIAASAVVRHSGASGAPSDATPGQSPWNAQDVRAALSLHPGFSGRRAACLLPMRATELSVLTLPPGRDAERRAMTAQELSSAFAGDRQAREFDFWEPAAAATADGAARDNVNVLSVPRRVARRAVRSLSEAGLRCDVMDGLPFALARAVGAAYPEEASPVAAVDWGHASATFCVVSGGRPRFTRHLRTCAFGPLVECVRRALGLSEEEATRVLTDYGLPGPGDRDPMHREIQAAVREVTVAPLNELADELNRTLSFVRARYAAVEPRRVCLFGEGATMGNVAGHVSERVGLPAEVWRMDSSAGEPSNVPHELAPLLGAAIALSLLAWSR